MAIELEMGGFYTCHQEGLAPVTIWIGRVDLPDDLPHNAPQPVVSLIVKSTEENVPYMGHAAFWESAALDGEMTLAEPFDLTSVKFAEGYDNWRKDYDAGKAFPWAMTPNEVHAQMLTDFLERVRK